jgi:hypothetical protein
MVHSGHGAEIEALLLQQQELVTQLRALILPQLHSVDSGSAELALQLFDDVIGCNTSLVSKLFSVRGGAAAEPVDDKSLVRKNSASTTANDDVIHERMEKQGMPSRSAGGKRRCVCAHISFQINLMHRTCSQKLIKSMFICDILYILSSICMIKTNTWHLVGGTMVSDQDHSSQMSRIMMVTSGENMGRRTSTEANMLGNKFLNKAHLDEHI